MKVVLFLLISLIVFFATNDGLRDTFLENSALSYLKESIVFILFLFLMLIIVFSKHRVFTKGMTTFNLVAFFLLATSFITTMMAGFESFTRADALSFGGWSVWIKVLVFVLLTNSLILLYKTDRIVYDAIPRLYIKGVVFYSILTIFFVASGLNESLPMRDWYGRLSIGYPTMDSFVLVVACVFLAFCVRNITYVLLLHLLFTIVLVMQNTVSGYLLFLCYLFFMIFMLQGKWKLIPLLSLSIVCIVATYIYINLATEMGAFGMLILDKIDGFIFGSETASVTIRQEQISDLLDILKSDTLLFLFGIGGVGAFAVENQFYSIFGMFGLVGICLYGTLFLCMFFVFKQRKDYFSCILVLLHSIGSISLSGIYLYPLIFVASYIISRFYLGYNNDLSNSQLRWNSPCF